MTACFSSIFISHFQMGRKEGVYVCMEHGVHIRIALSRGHGRRCGKVESLLAL